MEHVPPFDAQGVIAEEFVAGGAPDVHGDVVAVREDVLGAQSFVDDRSAAEDVRLMGLARRPGLELVKPLEIPSSQPGGMDGIE